MRAAWTNSRRAGSIQPLKHIPDSAEVETRDAAAAGPCPSLDEARELLLKARKLYQVAPPVTIILCAINRPSHSALSAAPRGCKEQSCCPWRSAGAAPARRAPSCKQGTSTTRRRLLIGERMLPPDTSTTLHRQNKAEAIATFSEAIRLCYSIADEATESILVSSLLFAPLTLDGSNVAETCSLTSMLLLIRSLRQTSKLQALQKEFDTLAHIDRVCSATNSSNEHAILLTAFEKQAVDGKVSREQLKELAVDIGLQPALSDAEVDEIWQQVRVVVRNSLGALVAIDRRLRPLARAATDA